MAEQNVEPLRRFNQTYSARDVEALTALCDPEIEWCVPMTVHGGAVYRGHDGVRTWLRDQEDAFEDELRVEPKV